MRKQFRRPLPKSKDGAPPKLKRSYSKREYRWHRFSIFLRRKVKSFEESPWTRAAVIIGIFAALIQFGIGYRQLGAVDV